MQIPVSQACLSAQSKVTKLCAPLFGSANINFFSYSRDFGKNKSISLQTDNDVYYAWHELKSPYCGHVIPDGVYTSDMIHNSELREHTIKLNYGNGIHIFKQYKSFREVITFFGPSCSVNVLQFYVNNIKLINKFLFFFKDEGARLINDAINDPITIPESMKESKPSISNLQEIDDSINNLFMTKNFHFEDNPPIKLSKREFECLKLYLKGLSTSQIADIINVKKVTVDTFMKMVKIKFSCSSKSELFDKLWRFNILQSNGMFD